MQTVWQGLDQNPSLLNPDYLPYSYVWKKNSQKQATIDNEIFFQSSNK